MQASCFLNLQSSLQTNNWSMQWEVISLCPTCSDPLNCWCKSCARVKINFKATLGIEVLTVRKTTTNTMITSSEICSIFYNIIRDLENQIQNWKCAKQESSFTCERMRSELFKVLTILETVWLWLVSAGMRDYDCVNSLNTELWLLETCWYLMMMFGEVSMVMRLIIGDQG